jgi:hypothetical protein
MQNMLDLRTGRVMTDEVLFGSSPASELMLVAPWEKMRDNPTDKRPGWNFPKDPGTKMPLDGERWLHERVGQGAAIRDRFIEPGTQSGIRDGIRDG